MNPPVEEYYFGIRQDEYNSAKFHFTVAFAYGDHSFLLSASTPTPTQAWNRSIEFMRQMIAGVQGKAVS